MAEGDAESRELPICAPYARYSDEEEADTETKTERIQLLFKECLYCEQEVRLMQRRMPTPDLSPIHKRLSEHAVREDLVVVRLSARAKRLIFKSSVRKGVEIVVPHGAASSWVVEMTENRIPWIKTAQQHVREGRGQLNPREINLKALGETWSVDDVGLMRCREGCWSTGNTP